jgi:hypothetical protein
LGARVRRPRSRVTEGLAAEWPALSGVHAEVRAIARQ